MEIAMKRLFFLLAICLFSTGAYAQHAQVPGTPTAVIHDNVTNSDVTVGVWAEYSPVVGDYIILAEHASNGWLGIWTSNPQYPHFDASITNPDVAKQAVVASVPFINAAIKNRFAIPASGPAPSGVPTTDAVNQALYIGFKFKVLPDGTTVFAAD